MTKLAEFIKTHADDINNNNFAKVYRELRDEVGVIELVSKFTDILLDAEINPLMYMESIPAHYMDGSKRTSVSIPNTVKSIGDSAFWGCTRLTSVKMPNSVSSIGHAAFFNCIGLTSVTLGNSVTSIGDDAFYNCSKLTSVTLPNSVKSIGIKAFYGCSSLTSITIPDSVTSIGSYAFHGCGNLKDIMFNGTIKQWREIEKATKGGLGVAKGTKIVCKDGEIIK